MVIQRHYQHVSYVLLLFWITLLPVIPVSLSGLLIIIFSSKWLLLLLKRSSNGLMKFACISLSLAFMQINGLLGFSVNGFIHLAALGIFLKFFEVQEKKDMLSLLYLMIFIGVTPLLLSQEILQTGLVFLVFLFTLTNLITIGQNSSQNNQPRFLQALTFSFTQLVICLPIMLILFLIFPRLPPLWTMPEPEHSAKTGLSNRMSPGSIAQLAESNERAFKVSFLNDNGELITNINSQPAINKLYWRVLTMDRYDGGTWYQSAAKNKQFHTNNSDYGDTRRYKLYMDKTKAGWLAVLNRPMKNLGIGQWQSDSTAKLRKAELASKNTLFVYEGETSYRAYQENPISSLEHKALLVLPEDINPKTHELAKSLRFSHSNTAVSDTQYIDNILNYFTQDFIYTLRPPLLNSRSQIDQFLFESKQGFCGHYASALAVMARMQGIPARIVNGYLGGTFNPHGGFWEIQQKEAHAWVELYYDQQWHRVDPTAFVSDTRISQGMDSLIDPTRNLVEKALNSAWVVSLQQRLQAINHFWDQTVLSYNGAAQASLANQLIEGWKKWGQWFYLTLITTLIIIVIAIVVLKPQWVKRLLAQFYDAIPVHQRLMNTFDQILIQFLNKHSLTLNDIHNMSISERKVLVKQSNTVYRSLLLQFLTEYQYWRFHPDINGATTGEGRKTVIRLKKILQCLSNSSP